jgi:hypothetical protein
MRGLAAVFAMALMLGSVDGVARLTHGTQETVDALTGKYPFYHTSSSLADEAASLAASCSGLSVSSETDGGASVPVAHLTALGQDGANAGQELKVLMVFGEHARELISPETGLAWLRKLCGTEGSTLRQKTSFVMVLNANPQGRSMVEGGEYCTRTNENGVDLNRNYGFHWVAEHPEDDETGVGTKAGQPVEAFSSGSGAFSEPETRIVKRLINQTRPDIFLDVHSGTKGLFMPYDWTTDPIPNESDRQHMKSVLQEVNAKDCPECMVGDCAETVGYLAPGSSADYAYSEGVPFSFIWEIYADAADAEQDAADQRAFLAKKKTDTSLLQQAVRRKMLGHTSSSSISKNSALLVGTDFGADVPSWAAGDEAVLAPMEQETKQRCLLQFNPLTQAEYDSTVSRWTNAFVTLCDAVRRVKGSA